MKSSTNPIRFGITPNSISLGAPAPNGSVYDERELEQKIQQAQAEAYQRGFEEGIARMQMELQEQRDALSLLQEGTLQSLTRQHQTLVEQVGASLPQLAIEVTQRVLAGFEPDLKHIVMLVDEVLREIAPSATQVEVWLSEGDLALMQDVTPELIQRHPGLHLLCDPDMRPGDCRARSRFGTINACLDTKLKNVARSLSR